MFYFGGVNGFTYFHPDSIIINKYQPPLVFNDFYLNDTLVSIGQPPLEKSINSTAELKLKYYQNSFGFQLAALNYSTSEKNQYAYKMDGLYTDSINIGTRRYVSFTNLSPGTYYFRAKGSNNDGVWNKEYRTIKIIIAPPWWKTIWAYLLYFILGLLLLIYIYRRRQSVKTEKHRQEKEALKSKLYANITHEFRTPIAIIMGIANDLKNKLKGIPNEDSQRQLEIVVRNGGNLLDLVNQMLDQTQLDFGEMEVKWEYGNVVPYLKYLGESFESYAAIKKIKLSIYCENEEIKMDFDRGKFHRIISNILTNAIKHSQEGGKIVFHAKKTIQKESDFLIMKIKDYGEGISQEALPYIFDRFYRVESSLRNKAGTGIGLALVKGIVELLGGKIGVKSEFGNWTEFEVMLPIHHHFEGKEEIKTKKELEKNPNILLHRTQKKTEENISGDQHAPILLLIEDNEDLLVYLAQNLRGSFEIAIARDGEEGISKAIQLIPDIIISDVMMPKKDGFEVCRFLKNDERTNHIPVILLTAKAAEKDRQRGFETGAIDYLIKPFGTEELLLKIQNLLFLKQKIQLASGKKESKPPFLIKVEQIIKKHISEENFNAHELAAALLMPIYTLDRKIKGLINKTARQYLEGYRLDKAKELLQQKELTITEIAFEVGFSSLPYFSRRFKEKFGYPPSDIHK